MSITGKTFQGGRQPRSHNPKIPFMRTLLAGKPIPAFPEEVDYTVGMPSNLGVMMNDQLGDCTCAAFYHALQVWSYNTTGQLLTEDDAEVEILYERACGYIPGNPATDNGGNEQQVLTYLLNEGAPVGSGDAERHKLTAFYEIHVNHIDAIKSAINACGVLYMGIDVPQYITPPEGNPPAVWTLEPSADNTIVGGHAIIAAGYNNVGLKVISWGQYYTMTWDFFSKFTDEAYALVDVEWVKSNNSTPAGLTLDQLEQAMAELRN